MTTPTPLRIHPFGPLREGDREILNSLTPEQKKQIAVCSCFSTSANEVIHPLAAQLQSDWLAGRLNGTP